MLLIQKLLTPVFVGLVADLIIENKHFQLFKPIRKLKQGWKLALKSFFQAVSDANLRCWPNKFGRKQLRFI